MLNKKKFLAVFLYVCDIAGSRRGVSEDEGLLGYDALSLGKWFPTFRKNVLPLASNIDRFKTKKDALHAKHQQPLRQRHVIFQNT
jgi:hypothetical protein